MPTLPPLPDVYRRQDLLNHVRDILAFYHPRAIDPSGGLYHFFKDDGTVFDAQEQAPMPVAGSIPGFSEALKRMKKGGKCRPESLVLGCDQSRSPVKAMINCNRLTKTL